MQNADRGREEVWPLPALRTVRAVLPHTALQSLVSTSGVSRRRKGSATGDPPMRSEGALAMCSLDAVASADTRRSVQIEPSARHLSGFRASAACLALSGTDQTLIGSISPRASNFLPPFPQDGFASHPSRRTSRQRYYEGSDSCRAHQRPTGLSAYSALPSRHSDLNHAGGPTVALSVASAPPAASGLRHERAGSPPLHAESGSSSPACAGAGSTDWRFISGCSPPRLTATQLPSITEPTTGSGADLHRAAKASSRTHSSPR